MDRTACQNQRQRRAVGLFDAVAGRVALRNPQSISLGREPSCPAVTTGANHATSRDARLPPDQVLFGQKYAPDRFAEDDIYFERDNLAGNDSKPLPHSDLLKSVHSYSSKFYESLALRQVLDPPPDAMLVDERSMDETALLAVGMLLEEASRHALGRQGDLVFTEEMACMEGTFVEPAKPRADTSEPSLRHHKRIKLARPESGQH